MMSTAILLIRKALGIILENLEAMNRWWGLKNRFDAQPRRTIGEIGIALSILGTSHQIIYPLLGGGIPFIIAVILIGLWLLSYWLRRAGISDPRLWDLTMYGIAVEVLGVILGGIFMAHPGMGVIQHILRNILFRGALVGIGSILSAGATYIGSALPGDFEGEDEPEPDRTKFPPNLNDYDYQTQWKNEDTSFQGAGRW